MSFTRPSRSVFTAAAAFVRDDRGNATSEYALVSAVLGFAGIIALLAVSAASLASLIGTQARVQNAAISPPSP